MTTTTNLVDEVIARIGDIIVERRAPFDYDGLLIRLINRCPEIVNAVLDDIEGER